MVQLIPTVAFFYNSTIEQIANCFISIKCSEKGEGFLSSKWRTIKLKQTLQFKLIKLQMNDKCNTGTYVAPIGTI